MVEFVVRISQTKPKKYRQPRESNWETFKNSLFRGLENTPHSIKNTDDIEANRQVNTKYPSIRSTHLLISALKKSEKLGNKNVFMVKQQTEPVKERHQKIIQ